MALVVLLGCGSDNPYAVRRAQGTIKYADGSLIPADRIELRFISQQPPVDKKTHPRQGIAEVDVADGSFVVTTYEYGDGLIRGKHKVLASSMAAAGGYTPHIPPAYRNTKSTPLEVDTETANYDLVIEKP